MVPEIYRFGEFSLDVRARELRCRTTRLDCGHRTFDTLVYLVQNRDRAVSAEELQRSVWRDHARISSNSVEKSISELRKALGDSAADSRYVRTLPRVGYRFIADVSLLTPNARRVTASKSRILVVLIVAVALVVAVVATNAPAVSHRSVRRWSQITYSPHGKVGAVFPLGDRLVCTEQDGGRYWIAEFSPASPAGRQLDVPILNPYLCDVSRSQSKLLVRSVSGDFDNYGNLWVIERNNTRSGQVLSGLTAFDGVFSPDEQSVIVSRGHQILSRRLDSDETKVLATVSGFVWWPRWSPDGRKFRFTVTESDTQATSIWEAGTSVTQPRRILPVAGSPPNPCCGVWSADGSTYYFQGGRGDDRSIWLLSTAGWSSGQPEKLAANGLTLRGPSIAGSRLLARSHEQRSEPLRWRSPSLTAEPLQPGLFAGTLDYRRDGTLAYTDSVFPGVWLRDPGGKPLRQLRTEEASHPAWSPAGSELAATIRSAGTPWRLIVIDPNHVQSSIEFSDRASFHHPTWLDNHRIVLGRIPTLTTGPFNLSVFDTGSRSAEDLPETEGLYCASALPGANRIAAVEFQTGEMIMYDVETATRRKTAVPVRGCPAWARDGRSIWVLSPSEHGLKLGRFDTEQGQFQVVGDLGAWSAQDRWLGVDLAGMPLFVRDLTRSNIYELSFEP